ncbi:hypothetical protein E2C01_019059 [Portunus trituberculatus]|uniref:Uncharacterized protein n=1 Tax=Portunus trituberculatus TaxID=210409 RepID=A0A5B7DX91_PORTR|nr:hypothetical protein [Portunus trituberculatus]
MYTGLWSIKYLSMHNSSMYVYVCMNVYVTNIDILIPSVYIITDFHIHSADYLVVLYNFRNSCEGLK